MAGFERDSITLGWEERLRTRARRRSDRGFEFATALPRGTILYQDDCFVFDAERIIVRVVELEEPMLVVRPASHQEWGLYAYHIGNSHQPMMIIGDAIVCPDALGMASVVFEMTCGPGRMLGVGIDSPRLANSLASGTA